MTKQASPPAYLPAVICGCVEPETLSRPHFLPVDATNSHTHTQVSILCANGVYKRRLSSCIGPSGIKTTVQLTFTVKKKNEIQNGAALSLVCNSKNSGHYSCVFVIFFISEETFFCFVCVCMYVCMYVTRDMWSLNNKVLMMSGLGFVFGFIYLCCAWSAVTCHRHFESICSF